MSDTPLDGDVDLDILGELGGGFGGDEGCQVCGVCVCVGWGLVAWCGRAPYGP